MIYATDSKFGPVGSGTEIRSALIQGKRVGHTHKYDRDGNLLAELDVGGFSLGIDPTDSSVWIGGIDSQIHHFSGEAEELGSISGVGSGQKHIAVVNHGMELNR